MGMMDRVVEWERLERGRYVKELTDTERMDFLDEYCLVVSVKPASQVTIRRVTVTCDDVVGKGETWREAVDDAAARIAEENGFKFMKTFCSHCGGEFGPGNHGFSRCEDHRTLRRKS